MAGYARGYGEVTAVRVRRNEFGPNRAAAVETLPPRATDAVPVLPEAPDAAAITAALRSAGDTLRRVPMPSEIAQLVGRVSSHPSVVASRMDYAPERARVRPAAPSPDELDELDEALRWVLWLDQDERRIVAAHGIMGVGLRKIAEVDPQRRGKSTIQRVYRRGIVNILRRLRAEKNTCGHLGRFSV